MGASVTVTVTQMTRAGQLEYEAVAPQSLSTETGTTPGKPGAFRHSSDALPTGIQCLSPASYYF